MGYVLRTTSRHMRKDIDVSIRKTFARLPEFENNQEKAAEVFQTLAMLHGMRQWLDSFQLANRDKFQG